MYACKFSYHRTRARNTPTHLHCLNLSELDAFRFNVFGTYNKENNHQRVNKGDACTTKTEAHANTRTNRHTSTTKREMTRKHK